MTEGAGRAFVPGHVTLFFAPVWLDDPAQTGSIGAGITITEGVTVEVVGAEDSRIHLNGQQSEMDAVTFVLDDLGFAANVSIETRLPVGAGFGVSGAAALGTALAANHPAGTMLSENQLTRIAHCAEVRAGTGLGDVVAQARGGIPIRVEAGAPSYGSLDGIPESSRIEYVSFGELPTAEILAGETQRLSTAGKQALSDVLDRPTLASLFAAGRSFARATDLLDPEIESVITDVHNSGGEAAMAMLGKTVISLDTGLSDAGYDARVCQTRAAGAGAIID